MATVEVRDGRPVLVRTGGPELRREAALLTMVAGPGVPEVLVLDDDGTHVRLVTSVAPALPLAPGHLAAVLADVARVLARTHAAGLVHGSLSENHVLGAPGNVLVGGWEEAGPGDPATDVAELGRLLARHADGDRTLLSLAARATAAGAPTAASMAESLQAGATPSPGPARRLPTVVLAGLATALALVACGLVLSPRRGETVDPALAAAPARSTSTTAVSREATTTEATTTTWAAHRLRVMGNIVERDGERWTVGRPGDVVVLGDWDCDGEVTPAVLRPTTGQVWSFARWSAAGAPEAGRTLGTIRGATSARVSSNGRCDRLEVLTADGQSTTVG
jgi:hypothetical protein